MPLTLFDRPVDVLVVGASRGIGLGFARDFAASGGVRNLYCAARDPHASEGLRELAGEHGDRIGLIPLDIADEASIEAAATALKARTEALSLVVNTVGVLHDASGMQPERRLADIEPGNLLASYRVNTIGPVLLAKHLADLLPRRERCVFATLSARVGSIGDNRLGGWYAYRASKAAQNMMTVNLSIELKRRHKGIICIALHPGTVETGLSEPFRGGVPDKKLFSVAQSVGYLTGVINGLTEDDNGRFFAWDGKPIPW
jgi:NAD(P)-dependent dehydrogenase (short-subunit alcohol dehydrogenase family)